MTGGPAGTRPVRDEDAFDADRLAAWLKDRTGDLTGTPQVRQFSGGASNLTYLLRYPERDLILRRPPAGRKASSAHDMRREYRVQELLRPVYPWVPSMIAFCDDPEVLGGDFYVMERLAGTILRGDLPPDLTLDPAATRALALACVDRLVDLHRVDPAETGLSEFGRGDGYVRRQVTGWSRRYEAARTPGSPRFASVMAWLEAHQPPDVAATVIHNDFRFDNVVLRPSDPDAGGAGRLDVVGVLDWEMATVGDPLMDLGASLAYWVQADDDPVFRRFRRQPTHLPGMPTRAEVVAYYGERTGIRTDDWAFYEVFGLFRLAVIAQQIYYRYHHGQTRNPAFRMFWAVVRYLDWRCRRTIRQFGTGRSGEVPIGT